MGSSPIARSTDKAQATPGRVQTTWAPGVAAFSNAECLEPGRVALTHGGSTTTLSLRMERP